MNVIFLDIDGVLNSDAYFKTVRGQHGFVEIDKTTLPILEEIVEENQNQVSDVESFKVRALVGTGISEQQKRILENGKGVKPDILQ